MNKKVLITVSGGIASAYAEPGVDVVIVDLDDAKDADPNELDPHSQRIFAVDEVGSSFNCLARF